MINLNSLTLMFIPNNIDFSFLKKLINLKTLLIMNDTNLSDDNLIYISNITHISNFKIKMWAKS